MTYRGHERQRWTSDTGVGASRIILLRKAVLPRGSRGNSGRGCFCLSGPDTSFGAGYRERRQCTREGIRTLQQNFGTHREGGWVPYEHKLGRPARDSNAVARAWPSDSLQVSAYGMLLEEATGSTVSEGRIRYHQENVTVRVPLDHEARERVKAAIARARIIIAAGTLPPVAQNENLCLRCSLAPVCLPEEERLARDSSWEAIRLFPAEREGQTVHVLSQGARVCRAGYAISVVTREGASKKLPIHEVSSLILHGNVQVTTQAIHLCAHNGVTVHWLSSGGRHIAGTASASGSVQRRLRQYKALSDPALCLRLARRLTMARVESQLRYLLRETRKGATRPAVVEHTLATIRSSLKGIWRAEGIDSLRGMEGFATRAYFEALPYLLTHSVPEPLRPSGRSRRPPMDRFNALLSYGYSLLYATVLETLLSVGLEPSIGFMHTPRSAAHPLVLDIMELFRLPVWDLALVASINRGQWDSEADFAVAKEHVWLTDSGKRKAIQIYQSRLEKQWRHPVIGYSLSYGRLIELEVRLLEKEWTSQPGLFARMRPR